jgi:hypothetical protein
MGRAVRADEANENLPISQTIGRARNHLPIRPNIACTVLHLPQGQMEDRTMHDTIQRIRAAHSQRCFAMEQRKRANLSLLSFLRLQLGWRKDLPKAERDVIANRAKAIASGDDGDHAYAQIVHAGKATREPWDKIEAQSTREMKRLAKRLPVWAEFGQTVNGFGELGLAIIVGEAGNLSNYPDKGKLWKRLGLALVDGVRQGGLTKSAPAAEWIKHGYSAQRRSRIWTLGDALKKCAGPYRDVYLARKAYERERAEAEGLTVCESAKIPAKRKDEFMSLGHIDRRGQRYMEKRLIRDLWNVWRACEKVGQMGCADEARGPLSTSSQHHDHAEQVAA